MVFLIRKEKGGYSIDIYSLCVRVFFPKLYSVYNMCFFFDYNSFL